MGWRADGQSVSAGQIDALYVDKDGLHYLFDFKRVAKNHKLDPEEKGFTPGRGMPPACGLGPMAHLPDTHFQKYSLQTSIYNLMLENTHRVDVGDRMYLLRMHADRDGYELVKCRDLRAEAKTALQSEAARLATRPPPVAPAAPQATPAAPQAASPPAGDAQSGRAAQGGSGSGKRPRGPAPKGKVWQDGQWIDCREARCTTSPMTQSTLKPRPCGQIPKGKMWDSRTGCWVDRKRGFSKLAAPGASSGDENSPPEPRCQRRRTQSA